MTVSICSNVNCVEEDTVATLTRLHEAYLQTPSMNVFDYLMDAAQYLKTGDLIGWKDKFCPVEVKEPIKRLRQSPLLAPVLPLPPCKSCRSEEVIDDVKEGQIVCLACGLIQQQGVFSGGIAHCSYDQISNNARACIHRYSRVVHFMTVIRLGEGNSRPVVDPDTLLRMQVDLVGEEINGGSVRSMLRRTGLSRRYRRHAAYFAELFGGKKKVEIPGSIVYEMAKTFRVVEFFNEKKHKRIWTNGRKAFFSYKFILYQFLHHLGHPEYTGRHDLLKSEKLLNVQRDAYRAVCRYTGYKLFQ